MMIFVPTGIGCEECFGGRWFASGSKDHEGYFGGFSLQSQTHWIVSPWSIKQLLVS